jgi:two-component system response regulator YesN
MYRLLIVDDEAGIREGLKKIIPWEEYGIEICGEAENGAEALKMAEALNPNIVFTDIKMPVLDGISFIKALKENSNDCKVVVLSGFSEYELVRQAMRYGAVDYILKPSGKEEIEHIIGEIIDNIEDEVISRLKNSEHLQLLKNNILNRVIRNDISSRELREKMKFVGLDLTNGPMSIAIIKLVKTPPGKASTNHSEETEEENSLAWKTFAIYNVCNEMLEAKKKGIVFTDAAGYVVIIFTETSEEAVDKKIKEILDDFIAYINKTLKIDVSIAVGSTVRASRNLYKSYEDAYKTLEYQFVFGINTVLFYQEIRNYFGETNKSIELDHDLITRLLAENNYDELEKYIKKLFVPFYTKDKFADGYVLRNCALEIIILVLQSFSGIPMTDRGRILKIKEEALHKVATESSLVNLQDTILDTLKTAIEERTITKHKKYSRLILEVIHNIEGHYTDPNLSLQSLADKMHVNTAYLGRIFKKETNHSFTSYLNLFRVEKAKKLYLTTNYKGTEICDKVGFANYNYFYIVFRKIEGMNPTDFRK